MAFFDNHIVDADAPSYVEANISWDAVANHASSAKKAKYGSAAEELRASFTPLVCSTEGVLHREYAAYQKRLACRLASKWQMLVFFLGCAIFLEFISFDGGKSKANV